MDVKPERVKLSVAAKMLNVCTMTVRRGIAAGHIPVIRSHTGRLFVPIEWIRRQLGNATPSLVGDRCAIYARESSSENRAALASQVDGLTRFAAAKGYTVVRIVREIGSGVNDNRPKLHKLLAEKDFDVLLVEHKDRLTRFGFRWFETLCPFKIEVINLADEGVNDLMEDLVAIITSFCARLYGQRRGRIKTEAAIGALRD